MADVAAALAKVAKMLPPDVAIPPPCFVELGGRFVDYIEGQELSTSWPLLPWFANPAGVVQGGIALTLFDNTFGPFSFLEAERPTTSLEMQISFLRPIPIGSGDVTVVVKKIEQTKSYILFNGELLRNDGKLACIASTRLAILNEYR